MHFFRLSRGNPLQATFPRLPRVPIPRRDSPFRPPPARGLPIPPLPVAPATSAITGCVAGTSDSRTRSLLPAGRSPFPWPGSNSPATPVSPSVLALTRQRMRPGREACTPVPSPRRQSPLFPPHRTLPGPADTAGRDAALAGIALAWAGTVVAHGSPRAGATDRPLWSLRNRPAAGSVAPPARRKSCTQRATHWTR